MCIVHRIYKVFAILFTAECSAAGLQRPGTASDVSQRDVSDQSSAIFVSPKEQAKASCCRAQLTLGFVAISSIRSSVK